MSKSRTNTTFKTPLLNDCTNHLAFQLDNQKNSKKSEKKTNNYSYETPISDVVTPEFVRGYN